MPLGLRTVPKIRHGGGGHAFEGFDGGCRLLLFQGAWEESDIALWRGESDAPQMPEKLGWELLLACGDECSQRILGAFLDGISCRSPLRATPLGDHFQARALMRRPEVVIKLGRAKTGRVSDSHVLYIAKVYMHRRAQSTGYLKNRSAVIC
ncbi:hypothetical protein LX36DRAFT_236312 [Colletotrichum falcatum]|nr:hypothetical protein LX36DRAFT_236312 [Colletotrichum falcatum]